MQRTLVGVLIVLMLAAAAAADPATPWRAEKRATESSLPVVKRPAPVNSCAAYGPGFVKLEGSDTCVHIGGAVSIGVGGSTGGSH